jgi:hypothetical protein
MMNLKLKDCQMEQITVTYLDGLHHDLKEELKAHDADPYLSAQEAQDVMYTLISIEVVMKDLMFMDAYIDWKMENGVDL